MAQVLKSVHEEQVQTSLPKSVKKCIGKTEYKTRRNCYSNSACPVYSDLLGHLSRNSCKLCGAPTMFESNLKATCMCTIIEIYLANHRPVKSGQFGKTHLLEEVALALH